MLSLVISVLESPINAPAKTKPPTLTEASQSGEETSLRIALLGYRSAPFSGGQGIYLHYLSRALSELGHEVTVISGPPYPELIDGVRLVKLESLDLYSRDLWDVKSYELAYPLARREWLSKLTGGFAEPWTFGERVRDWLLPRLEDFDIIHDNQTLANGILDLQAAGMPVVTTIHHPITRDLRVALKSESSWWRRLLIRRWHSFLLMQARVASQLDHIVTVSALSAKDIVADFGVSPHAIKVVPNGVDTGLFRPLPSQHRKARQVIATASADAPLKGLPVLLAAIKTLSQNFKNLELVLIARTESGGKTEALINQLNLTERVRFVSGLTREEIVRLYAESSVAVIPSLYEGFGLPAVEAMSCGIPVVSSNGGALPEVIGEAGLVVQAGDEKALAKAIFQVLTDSELAEALSLKGLERAQAQYSWSVCARDMVTFYRRAIREC